MIKINNIIALICLALFAPMAQAEDIKPFTSDGCSNFPNGTFESNQLWLGCCTAHDISYWKGGTYEQRLDADYELKSCVETVGEPEIAALMMAGVRVGGTPYFPTRFRWGYGWDYPRFYGELSEEELELIEVSMGLLVD